MKKNKILFIIIGLVLIFTPILITYRIPSDYDLDINFINDTNEQYFVSLMIDDENGDFYFWTPLIFPLYKELMNPVSPGEHQLINYEATGAGGSLLVLAKNVFFGELLYLQVNTDECLTTTNGWECDVNLSDFSKYTEDFPIIWPDWGIFWFVIRPVFYILYLIVSLISVFNTTWNFTKFNVLFLCIWFGVFITGFFIVAPAFIWM